MDRLENSINNEPSLNPCPELSPTINKFVSDPVVGNECGKDEESLRKVLEKLEDISVKTGLGSSANCDPIMTGQIKNDSANPNPNMLYKYSRVLAGTDEAMMDLFRNIIVIDENSKQHNVPLIWATPEKAVAFVLQENVRKDVTLSVDRIRLPLLAIHSNDINYAKDRYTFSAAKTIGRGPDGKPTFTTDEVFKKDTVFGYTRGIPVDIGYSLYVWTLYIEDMYQIIEQLFSKFNPCAYINVRGVWWEIIVSLDSVGNNVENEVGDQAVRVLKYQFNMTVKSYIPQPIERKKAVLSINEEIVNSIDDNEMTEILNKIEIAVKELER